MGNKFIFSHPQYLVSCPMLPEVAADLCEVLGCDANAVCLNGDCKCRQGFTGNPYEGCVEIQYLSKLDHIAECTHWRAGFHRCLPIQNRLYERFVIHVIKSLAVKELSVLSALATVQKGPEEIPTLSASLIAHFRVSCMRTRCIRREPVRQLGIVFSEAPLIWYMQSAYAWKICKFPYGNSSSYFNVHLIWDPCESKFTFIG